MDDLDSQFSNYCQFMPRSAANSSNLASATYPSISSGGQVVPEQIGDPRLQRKIVPFREIATCGDEVWIEHEGQLYRLRRTKQGKLILTK